MQRWQYKTVKVEAEGWMGGIVNVQELDDVLNDLGAQGWELTSVFDTNMAQGASREIVAVFKRPAD